MALLSATATTPSTLHAQTQERPPAFASTMRCGDRDAVVGVAGQTVVLIAGGERFTLHPVPAASGTRYEVAGDPGTSFWSKGASAQVSVRGQAWPECRMATPADQAAALQGAEWVVEDIGRTGLIDRSRLTLHFTPDAPDGASHLPAGQVSGRAGCNRYTAAWWLGDGGLRIGAAAGTRRACNPALDAQEARFLALLAEVRRHEISADGALRLMDASGRPLLLARRERFVSPV